MVPEPGLNLDLRPRYAGRDLDGFNDGVGAEEHRNGVVNARRPFDLLEVAAHRIVVGEDGGVGTDADHERVFAAPVDGVSEVEETGRETAGVFAQLPAVQPNRGAELGLVDLEPGHRLARRS